MEPLGRIDKMNEVKKQKGLWHNIRKRREKGLPKKKPGQKGYPKTLDIEEQALRNLIRSHLLKEYLGSTAMLGGSPMSAITDAIKSMFAPSVSKRLSSTGDDEILRDYESFIKSINFLPSYRVAWENFKRGQNAGRTSRAPKDIERRAVLSLKDSINKKISSVEGSLSQSNRDIWEEKLSSTKANFENIFANWEMGKITTGGLLRMLDPAGVVESRIRESNGMFAGKDSQAMKISELETAIESAMMDLDDCGCPSDSDPMTQANYVLEDVIPNRPEAIESEVTDLMSAIDSCMSIDSIDAQKIAGSLGFALDRYANSQF